jgi:transglutaminase-like putative cysteine protease
MRSADGRGHGLVSELWDRVRYPRAGWLSLGLLAVMALSVAWSVQSAAWLDQLEFLAPLALWAVLFGGLIGVVRVSILVSLPLGALLGAGFVLWAIGGEYHTALSQLGRLDALRTDALLFTASLLDGGYPSQMSPYAVGLGVLMWTTAFTAAYVVYRYHRVIDAILLMAAAIVTNMSAAVLGLGELLLFVIAALLLWLRAALVNRQDGWQRRRVNENVEVPPSIMRTGIIFAAGSVLLAYVLTSVAVAAPLTGAWRSLDVVWSGVRDQLEGVVGGLTNPNSRITGSSFGPSFTVFGEWVSNDEEVLVLAAERPLYLRTRTYDIYNGHGWESTDGPKRGVAAGDPLFEVLTSERPTAPEGEGVRLDSVSIEMRQSVGRQIFTAGSPLKVYAPTLITEPAGLPLLGFIESANAIGEGESYTQAVLISEATEAQLIATAGIEYPQAVQDLYVSSSGISPEVAAKAREVTEGAESPYEEAKMLARYLRGDEFTYSTAGLEIPAGADLVDTFLFDEDGKTGYCQHYASAMALMARSLGLPARVAVGWAPGEAVGDDLWLVREAQAHAWVEIYFPHYGWQIFEATKSIDPRFIRSPGTDGDPIAPPTGEGFDVWFQEDLERALQQRGQIPVLPSANPVEGAIDPTDPAPAPVEEGSRQGNALVMIVLVAGAAVVIFFQARRSRRRWRLLPAGDRAWQHLTLAADRAGVGPRPSETIYEYAGWLEEQLPRHGEPIRIVADGKVWQNYSGQPLTRSGANRLEVAWSRLRRPLMMLGLRRRLRRLARRGRPSD